MGKVYQVTGTLAGKKNGKQVREIEADSKASIWNKPDNYGFAKVFSVEEKKD